MSIRMKKYTAADIPSAPMPPFTAEPLSRYTRRKLSKKNAIPSPSSAPDEPNEETVNRLNGIGNQYPFCVYYKGRNHDPL